MDNILNSKSDLEPHHFTKHRGETALRKHWRENDKKAVL